MNETVKRLALTEDYTILQATDYLLEQLLRDNPYTLEELNSITSDQSDLASVIQSMADQAKVDHDQPLTDHESIVFARQVMFQFATQSESLRIAVESCLDNWPDERQSVGKIYARGIAISLILLVASTEIEYEDGKFTVQKHIVGSEQIKAVSGLVQAVSKNKSATSSNR